MSNRTPLPVGIHQGTVINNDGEEVWGVVVVEELYPEPVQKKVKNAKGEWVFNHYSNNHYTKGTPNFKLSMVKGGEKKPVALSFSIMKPRTNQIEVTSEILD